MRDVARAAAQGMYARWRRLPLQDAVLLEAFEGTSTACNPGAIAVDLLGNTDLRLVWALREPVSFPDPRIHAVKYRSMAYYRALASTRYLVNNVTFPPLFDKRDDQRYLNTWHGTPLKKMGRDVDGPYSHVANTVHNFEAADVLLSSGGYMTQTMYAGAYGIDTTNVAELGSPRVDVQFAATGPRDIVLYAPTWQEATYTTAANDAADVAVRIRAIADAVPQGLRPMMRLHGKSARAASADPGIQEFLAPPDIPTNSLLAMSHTVITDYSSLAFDFLATGSRLLFFTPVAYPRGTYLSDEQLPGPRTDSLAQLQQWLAQGSRADEGMVARARQRFCPHEDGKATRRVVERLLTY